MIMIMSQSPTLLPSSRPPGPTARMVELLEHAPIFAIPTLSQPRSRDRPASGIDEALQRTKLSTFALKMETSTGVSGAAITPPTATGTSPTNHS